MKKIIEQLRQLVRINTSSSPDPDIDKSNKELVYLLAQWLEDMKFEINIIPDEKDVNKLNLVATIGKGTEGPGIIFSGHTDTVDAKEPLWQTNPFELVEKNNRFYGLGVCDMKSFFPVFFESVREILKNKGSLKGRITLVATSNEEISMSGIRSVNNKFSFKQKFAIVGEPTRLYPVCQHKGIMMIEITLFGKSGHSSNPGQGKSAIEGMHEIMAKIISWRDEIQHRFPDDKFSVPFPTVNFGKITGGDIANRICDECSLSLDVRLMPGMKNQDAYMTLNSIVEKVSKKRGLEFQIDPIFNGVEPLNTDDEDDFVVFLEKVTGKRNLAVNYGTEGPFFQEAGISTVILGPGDIKNAHRENESISKQSLKRGLEIYKKIIEKTCL